MSLRSPLGLQKNEWKNAICLGLITGSFWSVTLLPVFLHFAQAAQEGNKKLIFWMIPFFSTSMSSVSIHITHMHNVVFSCIVYNNKIAIIVWFHRDISFLHKMQQCVLFDLLSLNHIQFEVSSWRRQAQAISLAAVQLSKNDWASEMNEDRAERRNYAIKFLWSKGNMRRVGNDMEQTVRRWGGRYLMWNWPFTSPAESAGRHHRDIKLKQCNCLSFVANQTCISHQSLETNELKYW